MKNRIHVCKHCSLPFKKWTFEYFIFQNKHHTIKPFASRNKQLFLKTSRYVYYKKLPHEMLLGIFLWLCDITSDGNGKEDRLRVLFARILFLGQIGLWIRRRRQKHCLTLYTLRICVSRVLDMYILYTTTILILCLRRTIVKHNPEISRSLSILGHLKWNITMIWTDIILFFEASK